MNPFKIGAKVAVPICKIFPEKKGNPRSTHGYDIGTVIAKGKNKKNGKPAVKVSIDTSGSVWAKKITKEPVLEKWALCEHCDQI